jgi:hypothetical protein
MWLLPSVKCLLAEVSEHLLGSIIWIDENVIDPGDAANRVFRNVGQQTLNLG